MASPNGILRRRIHTSGGGRPQNGQGAAGHHVEPGSETSGSRRDPVQGRSRRAAFRAVNTTCASWFRCVGVWIWNRFESPTWRRSGQYANIDLSRDAWREPITAFLDVLEGNVAELQDIECFISPAAVFGYLERIGFGATLASRKPADKQTVELLTGAVFTMFLDEANDYYVKPVKDDPPDVEVLAVERDSRAFKTMKLEIVQDGKYSESVFEVIGKKLAKRYERGTVLVVVIEETEQFLIADLHDFIRDNNPHGLRIYVIGGTGRAGRFKGLPCDEITCDDADYFEWKEMEVDQRDRNAGFLGHDGVFCETSGLARFLQMPLFVREVKLSR